MPVSSRKTLSEPRYWYEERLGRIYEGGRIEGRQFLAARWDLRQEDKSMWASVQTIRGCPKHCSLCGGWRTARSLPLLPGAALFRIYRTEIGSHKRVPLPSAAFPL